MTTLLDDVEKKLFKQVRRAGMPEPFMAFKELISLDLSSNLLSHFPLELNFLPKLRELNLINN